MNSIFPLLGMFRYRWLWLFVALLLISAPLRSNAQAAPLVFFLARNDSNSDGVIDPNDELQLFKSSYAPQDAGSPAMKVSANDASILQFDVSSAGDMVAYTADTPSGKVLDIVSQADHSSLRIPVSDITPTQVTVFPTAIWVVGLNSQNIPLIRGINPASGAVVNEHTFRQSNTEVSIQSGGRYVLAYNRESGGLSVLTST